MWALFVEVNSSCRKKWANLLCVQNAQTAYLVIKAVIIHTWTSRKQQEDSIAHGQVFELRKLLDMKHLIRGIYELHFRLPTLTIISKLPMGSLFFGMHGREQSCFKVLEKYSLLSFSLCFAIPTLLTTPALPLFLR